MLTLALSLLWLAAGLAFRFQALPYLQGWQAVRVSLACMALGPLPWLAVLLWATEGRIRGWRRSMVRVGALPRHAPALHEVRGRMPGAALGAAKAPAQTLQLVVGAKGGDQRGDIKPLTVDAGVADRVENVVRPEIPQGVDDDFRHGCDPV